MGQICCLIRQVHIWGWYGHLRRTVQFTVIFPPDKLGGESAEGFTKALILWCIQHFFNVWWTPCLLPVYADRVGWRHTVSDWLCELRKQEDPTPSQISPLGYWNCAHLAFLSIWIYEETAIENMILLFRHCFAVPCPRWKSRSLNLSHLDPHLIPIVHHYKAHRLVRRVVSRCMWRSWGALFRVRIHRSSARDWRDPYWLRLAGSILDGSSSFHAQWLAPVNASSSAFKRRKITKTKFFRNWNCLVIIQTEKPRYKPQRCRQKESALWYLRNMNGFVNFGGMDNLPTEGFFWQEESGLE